jgi:hypothetical protein
MGPRAAAAALGCLLVLSCGGSAPPVSTGPVASFTPDEPSPANGSVTLQPGEVSGRLSQVKVSVRGVPDFFGVAFWISYDTTAVAFHTFDGASSFLRDGGTDIAVQVDSITTPGKIKVGISRIQNAGGTVEGVDVTDARDLIVLSFIGTKAVVASPIAFVDGHGEVVGPSLPPGNGIAVTWAGGKLTVR